MAKRNSIRDCILSGACIVAICYVSIAWLVFAFRHPWMTSTEQLLYFGRALTWSAVDYEEARPRPAKPQ